MSEHDDEFALNFLLWEADDVASNLLRHGWAVTDPESKELEFFWPPTAPVGYGGLADWVDALSPSVMTRRTPWTRPTRLSIVDEGWLLEYGETTALGYTSPLLYPDEHELLADLARIEWWPMSPEEAQRLQKERIYSQVQAFAANTFAEGTVMTEPYGSRLDDIRGVQRGGHEPVPPQEGDRNMQLLLVESEAWTSAIRTARAGGPRWNPAGR